MAASPQFSSLGRRLKELRAQSSETQAEIAKCLGITVPAYSNYEVDKRKPERDILIDLAKHFDVSIDYLVGETDVPYLPGEGIDLPPEIQKYFRGGKWEALDPNDKKKLIRLIKGFIEEEE